MSERAEHRQIKLAERADAHARRMDPTPDEQFDQLDPVFQAATIAHVAGDMSALPTEPIGSHRSEQRHVPPHVRNGVLFVLAASLAACSAEAGQSSGLRQTDHDVVYQEPQATFDPTVEAASRGFWRWHNETCDTGGRDLSGFDQVRYMPGVYEGKIDIARQITVEYEGRSVTIAIVVPSDESGQPLFEPDPDIVQAVAESAEATTEVMLAAGYPPPKTFSIKNEITGEERRVIPIVITPPPGRKSPGYRSLEEGDGWKPEDVFAFGACIDPDGWGVNFAEDDTEVGQRFRKSVNLEHPTGDDVRDPRVLSMMRIAAAHELAHAWQAEFPMFAGRSHRGFLRIDFEAFATWFGLATQWDEEVDLLPMYQDFLIQRAGNKLRFLWAHNPYIEIDDGQRDYGGFIFWRGVQILLQDVSREHDLGWDDRDITIMMARLHRECNLRVMDYLGILDGATPDPHQNVQGIGEAAYQDVLYELLGGFGFRDGEEIHQRASLQGLVDFFIEQGWIENDLLSLVPVDISEREAILSYEEIEDIGDEEFLEISGHEGKTVEIVSAWTETDDIDPYAEFSAILLYPDGRVEVTFPETSEDGDYREKRITVAAPADARIIVVTDLGGRVSLRDRDKYPDILQIRKME